MPEIQKKTLIREDFQLKETLDVIEQDKLKEGYSILDELVGFCESKRKDASANRKFVC